MTSQDETQTGGAGPDDGAAAGIRRSEQALAAREERMRSILETAVEGIVTIDACGIVESANPAAERMFGYTEAELIGRNVSALMPAPFHDEHDSYLAAYLTTGVAKIIGIGREVVGRRKDGSTFPVYLSVGEHRIADGVRFTGILRDITEEKHTQDELRESRRALATLVGNLPGIAYRCQNDEHWTMEFVSAGCQELTGYQPEELVGNARVSFASMIHVADRRHVRETIEAAVAAREPFELTYRIETASRTQKTVLEHGCGVFDTSGELLALEGFIGDVTERKRLEREFLEAQKMEAIGRLAGGIAHDFNNLLMGILSACRMAAATLPEDGPARRLCEQIQREALKGAGLTRQLLDFSRKRTYEAKPLDLNEVVVEAEFMLGKLLGEDILLRTHLSPDGGQIVADRGRIDQVLMNLCVNARDAMPDGGELTISVSTEPARRAGGRPHVVLDIADTGAGMSAETQAKVFEPFFTTKGVGKGTGLGLSTVFGLVREFGGHIEVESGLGVGSCFRLTFPRSDQASAPAPDAVARSTYQHGGKIVLLVEDEPLVRAGVRHLLQELGYTVLVADHPAKALDLCSDAVDLLLTDIVMPGTNGPELAQELRSRFPRLRVLFMSAYSDEVLVDQGRIAPGQPVLEKPFEEHELAAMVRRALAAGPPAS